MKHHVNMPDRAPGFASLSPWWLAVAMAIMMLLMCATTLYNTKGEPREAVVALSMLRSGNWILPFSFGGAEMAYKPPMLAWCIALVSLLTGGVTELSSRLPSLIAAMLMVVSTARFFGRHSRQGMSYGLLAGWVTATSFEVFRAATACRVDMLLTAFMVGAMFGLYNWFESKHRHWLPWMSILLMSGACLTKGPVGIVIPCLVTGVYRLVRRDRFFSVFWPLVAAAVLALVLPLAWYVAAGQQGGERFIDLVMEENFGRMTGTMSYASHENPAWYNVMTLAAGMIPYTLLALAALAVVNWHGIGSRVKSAVHRLPAMSHISSFALTAAVIIFIFFCIPKSKRSVYLLPMYPFVAWGVTLLMDWLVQRTRGRLVARWFDGLFAITAILLPVAWVVMRTMGPDELTRSVPGWTTVTSAVVAAASVALGVALLRTVIHRLTSRQAPASLRCFLPAIIGLFATYTVLDCAILPPVLSAKSDITVAQRINELQPDGPVWSWVAEPMLRFYTTNMYISGRMHQVDSRTPDRLPPAGSLMVVGLADLDLLREATGRTFTPLWQGSRKSCDTRQIPVIVRIE